MNLARRKRRQHPEPIIALIDVVFFLLVFSMLVGRMDATAPFRVMPASSESGATMPGGGETVAISQDGTLALNGREIGEEELLSALATVLTRMPDRLIRINAHRGAELRLYLPLVAEIEGLGAKDIVLVVTPEGP
ncbi:ExbD/TolR family protein [Aliiruegeria sabulilitoris]|uniref:ExbD/TolR family protein n=1 Tax=Aliiruegeria sabulilitoris TaxID=1510458 RepID=UPI00082A7402|nr:biopolymer transporter ExbD [Aliiruegeria sabulilitoris]NDR56200.1 biopolymer transporter ExbD [Pseudoruegeria sp. M32A2M]